MKPYVLILTFVFIAACGNPKKKSDVSNQDTIAADKLSQTITTSVPSNTLFVNENCVIFLFPDSTEFAKMQEENDEDTYNEIVSDLTWYPGIAAEVLDSFNIKNITSDKEIIILKNRRNQETKYKRKELEGDMILFNASKEPLIGYAIDFDRDNTLKYFDK